MDNVSRKWRRKPGERPGEILASALNVFSEKGFRQATMDEIASGAGITKGTIYLYYAGKEDLFIEMVRAKFREAIELLPQIAFSVGQDPEALTRSVGKALLDVLMAPDVAKAIPLVIAQWNHIPALKRMYHEEILPRANLRLAELLELGMSIGIVRNLDPVIAARSLFGMFFIFVLTQEVLGARDVTPMNTESIVENIVSIYFHGILRKD